MDVKPRDVAPFHKLHFTIDLDRREIGFTNTGYVLLVTTKYYRNVVGAGRQAHACVVSSRDTGPWT